MAGIGPAADVVAAAVAFASRIASRRPLPILRERNVVHPDADAFLQFARNSVAAIAKGNPAPLECVEAVAASLKPFVEGVQIERQLFIGLVNSPESKALRHVFLAERAASKVRDVPEDTPTRPIRSAAVIGPGTMGGGIAISFASRKPERVATLTLISSAALGPEINAAFIDGFVRAARRREAIEALHLLVHDPALVSRSMVEDVLRYKRLDGVPEALAAFAEEWFPGGRQSIGLSGAVADLKLPAQIIWGREDRIIPVKASGSTRGRLIPTPRRSPHAYRFTSSSKPGTCRTWKKPARSIG